MAGQAGWNLYLIGNEDSVAFGNLSQQKWETFERTMLAQLHKQGIAITRNYACLENPDGEPPHDAESVFLLPNTGVFHHAAQVDGIDLRHSWVIGDSSLELVAGWRANCHLASVRTGEALKDGNFPVEPEFSTDCLADALAHLSQPILSKAS
jgi:histidinol phosphatase-like enzyme